MTEALFGLFAIGVILFAWFLVADYPPVAAPSKAKALLKVGGIYAVRMLGRDEQQPQHYRVTTFWRVLECAGPHVVVERAEAMNKFDVAVGVPRREMWVIDHHVWTEAAPLRRALAA